MAASQEPLSQLTEMGSAGKNGVPLQEAPPPGTASARMHVPKHASSHSCRRCSGERVAVAGLAVLGALSLALAGAR
eukprot:15485219-Alexandrium_andersonii.AAC.1